MTLLLFLLLWLMTAPEGYGLDKPIYFVRDYLKACYLAVKGLR